MKKERIRDCDIANAIELVPPGASVAEVVRRGRAESKVSGGQQRVALGVGGRVERRKWYLYVPTSAGMHVPTRNSGKFVTCQPAVVATRYGGKSRTCQRGGPRNLSTSKRGENSPKIRTSDALTSLQYGIHFCISVPSSQPDSFFVTYIHTRSQTGTKTTVVNNPATTTSHTPAESSRTGVAIS